MFIDERLDKLNLWIGNKYFPGASVIDVNDNNEEKDWIVRDIKKRGRRNPLSL